MEIGLQAHKTAVVHQNQGQGPGQGQDQDRGMDPGDMDQAGVGRVPTGSVTTMSRGKSQISVNALVVSRSYCSDSCCHCLCVCVHVHVCT